MIDSKASVMKKHVFLRIIGLVVLYWVVFIFLVAAQFTRRGNFSRQIGEMLINGQYRQSGEILSDTGEYSLEGGVTVFFGGLEFRLKGDNGSFSLLDSAGKRQAVFPEHMRLSADTADFLLPGGTELSFGVSPLGSSQEFFINGKFADGVSGVEIPFRPRRASVIRENGDGLPGILYNGSRYQFSRSFDGLEQRRLFLPASAPVISYRITPERKAGNPEDYIVQAARNSQSFSEALVRWTDQNFLRWNQNIALQHDEDTVIAYSGESIQRGNYRSAIAAIPSGFLSGPNRTWVSSVYLGGMNSAFRSFIAAERERTARISRLISEHSPELLKESRAFEFLLLRGTVALVDEGLEFIHTMDPVALGPETVPGVFEGWVALNTWRPNTDNPFERLTDQACKLIIENIQRDQDRVFIFQGTGADTELNIRTGAALRMWGEQTGKGSWAALGRSLLLSVISMEDDTGTFPARLSFSANGESGDAGGSRVSAAKLYRLLDTGENLPHAAVAGPNGIWTWTAASAISTVQESNVLDISVSFPVGETHYMMIRGIKPFSRIFIYNMEWRSDPQFERYDSSGWIYSSEEQVLILKMKHRLMIEHIQIHY